MKLNTYLTYYTKMNSKLTKDLNVKLKTTNFWEKVFLILSLGKRYMTSKA